VWAIILWVFVYVGYTNWYLFFSLQVEFFLYKLLPPKYQPFFPAPCSHWFLNLLKCAEHHSIHEQSAQKQQHGTVYNCSCSVAVQFAVTCVNHFTSLNFKEFLCVVLIIRMLPNVQAFSVQLHRCGYCLCIG